MGRPECGVDDYFEWQRRLDSYDSSDLSLSVFCLQEGVSRSSFYRWKDRLKDGIPESTKSSEMPRDQATSNDSVFVPVSLKASPVEIELPNGGVVRLPASVGQNVLVAIIRVVGSLRPWKAPQS